VTVMGLVVLVPVMPSGFDVAVYMLLFEGFPK
jgi:hypothetical protein